MLKNGNLARHLADAAFAEIFRELEDDVRRYAEAVSNWIDSSPRPSCFLAVAIR